MCSVESDLSGTKIVPDESDLSETKIVPKRKLKFLNLSDKVNLILEVEKSPHIKKKIFAKKYGIPANTLSTILKNKTIILDRYASNVNPKCKKLKSCGFPQIESALVEWCQTYHEEYANIPINGVMLREKAMKIAKEMGVEEFKASSGWLDKFKSRYKVLLTSINGEFKATTEEDSQISEEETLEQILKSYDVDNIFSIDESVLFYKCLQSKPLAENESSTPDEKKNKLTIVVGANASGTEKLPLVVIGKPQKIQLSSEDTKSHPVEYFSNKMPWMTCDLFERFIRKLDEQFNSRGRKVLLFVGNCRAHFEVLDLQAIKLETLLINPSGMSQPSEKSMVECLKRAYHEHLTRMTIVGTEKGVNNRIDVLQAVKILSKKWDNDVTQNMIIDYFKFQGLPTDQQIYDTNMSSIDELSMCENQSLNISHSNCIDESIIVPSDISDVNIIHNGKTKDEDPAKDICVLVESPSDTEVTMAIATLECYLKSRSNVNEELLHHLQKISDFVTMQENEL